MEFQVPEETITHIFYKLIGLFTLDIRFDTFTISTDITIFNIALHIIIRRSWSSIG